MNLKPNLWTILFVLVAGAWFFTAQGTSDTDPIYPPLDEYEIHQDDFQFGRKLYNELYNKYINVDSFPELAYPIVSYYTINQKEIASLHKHGDSIQVYAVPFIDYVNVKKEGTDKEDCIPVVNIAFSTVRPKKEPTDMQILGGKFYNFSAPCPPLCDTSSVVLCPVPLQ